MTRETHLSIILLYPILAFIVVKALRSWFCRSKSPLPPSRKSFPLIGDMFALTGDVKTDCKTYRKWCKELDTDIIRLNVIGTTTIVLNSYEASVELLEKRASTFSGRANMPMITDLMGWDFHFALMDYGNSWRQHRKLMHQEFHASAAKQFRPRQLKAARGLLKRLLNEPEDVVGEIRQLAGEVILSIAYGIDVKSMDDRYIQLSENAIDPLNLALVPGSFMVNIFPSLMHVPEWFPGAGFKRKAKEWRKSARGMVEIPFEETKEGINNGTANPSFVMQCLQKINSQSELDRLAKERTVKSVAGTMYQTGSETTAVGVATGVLALLENPEILKKAQREMDSVVPPGNLPDFSDEQSLPYITAMVKEILRYQAVAPIGVPHVAASDDVYKGYHIPKGSILFSNIWGILHDENVFPDPEKFNPERFLKNDEVAEGRLQVVWGYGRRVCVGRHMAFSTIWIALASIIAVYDISKPVDKNGNVIHPSHEYTRSSILPFPLPFKAVFKPRSKTAEDLIRTGYGI